MRAVAALCLVVFWMGLGVGSARPESLQIGKVLYCTSADLLEQFVELGADKEALDEVNTPIKDKCAVMTFAYVPLEKIKQVHLGEQVFTIVEIMVFGEDHGDQVEMLELNYTLYSLTTPGSST